MKKHLVRIIRQRMFAPWGSAGKLLLGPVAIAVAVVPILSSPANAARRQAQSEKTAPTLAYDVVSLKPLKTPRDSAGIKSTPDGLIWLGATLNHVITGAYGVRWDRVVGMPTWASSDLYDLQVKMGDETLAEFQKLPQNEQQTQRFRMLQPVLEERLKLKVHRETKIVTVYSLEAVAKPPVRH